MSSGRAELARRLHPGTDPTRSVLYFSEKDILLSRGGGAGGGLHGSNEGQGFGHVV